MMEAMDQFASFLDKSGVPIDAIYGLMACVFAIAFGVVLAKKQEKAFRPPASSLTPAENLGEGHLPNVNFFDYGDMRFLHLGSPAVQGSMRISKPFEIHLDYQQRMMGWLLFVDLDRVHQMHAMQLGLGAGSLTKFCLHHLDMQTTAIELNPQVLTTCRQWFNLPQDDTKLKVILADAAKVVNDPQWVGKIDALQVDLYDQEAAQPVFDSEDFYRKCHQLLADQGCMTVNLFGHAHNFEKSLQNITAAFAEKTIWQFKPTHAGNTIVIALKKDRGLNKTELLAQAKAIEKRWPLPTAKWGKALTRVDNSI